jgi:hypothetical protein
MTLRVCAVVALTVECTSFSFQLGVPMNVACSKPFSVFLSRSAALWTVPKEEWGGSLRTVTNSPWPTHTHASATGYRNAR